MKVLENIPISTLTTMRLGGPAKYVIEIEEVTDIKKAYDFAKNKNLKTFILGKGANTIGLDEGFDGVVLISKLKGIIDNDGEITAMSGEEWDDVVAFSVDKNYTGIEALSKIPGSAGAAPVQNIGAYGQDVSEVFLSAKVYDTKDETIKTLEKSDFNFSYRKSVLNTTEKNRFFIISITLKLKKGIMSRPFYNSIEKFISENPEKVAKFRTEVNENSSFSPALIRKIVSKIREDKLPDPLTTASAGSFFKNIYLSEEEAILAEKNNFPVYHGKDGLKINSGWLIEKAGLKGELLHGMRVSEKASLVLINESAKNYADLKSARTEIIEKVKQFSGFTLEQEPMELK